MLGRVSYFSEQMVHFLFAFDWGFGNGVLIWSGHSVLPPLDGKCFGWCCFHCLAGNLYLCIGCGHGVLLYLARDACMSFLSSVGFLLHFYTFIKVCMRSMAF